MSDLTDPPPIAIGAEPMSIPSRIDIARTRDEWRKECDRLTAERDQLASELDDARLEITRLKEQLRQALQETDH